MWMKKLITTCFHHVDEFLRLILLFLRNHFSGKANMDAASAALASNAFIYTTIIHNNKIRVTDRQKARAFMSHYKKTSNITLKKEDIWAKKAVNEHLRKPTCDTEHEKEFTVKELKSALSSVDGRKAAGPDKIHPKMLKKLVPSALAYLLDLFNNVWKTSQVPQMWRTADIRPIPKKGKDLRDVRSFRPISPTSVVGKLMERMVCTRLRHFLESNNLLNPNQAGFRSKRSTEDQLLGLYQTVSDEFQKKPMHRTVLALVDYSRAFDTVWRDALLWKMIQKGIGTRIKRWTQSWLSNRLAYVTFGNASSQKRVMKQGVPQGSVISPLLFIIYIVDITNNIPPEVIVSLFADDVALYSSSIDLATAEARIQEALNAVAQWSTKWKLTISVGKCEASFFSTNSHESKWRPKPELTIGEFEIPYSENPKFLGVIYDKQLTFTEHANNVAKSAKSKSRALVHLAGTDWGYDKATLRSTYLAIGRTTMDYAGAAWQPWLSKTSFEQLESAQRFTGRIITGHLKTTPNECILLDTNLTSMVTKCRQNAVIALEKSKRLPPNNPRRQVKERQVKQRTTKPSWRNGAIKACEEIFENEDHTSPFPPERKPWTDTTKISFRYSETKKSDSESEQRKAGEQAILETGDQGITFYTDGSAAGGNCLGGAGVVEYENDREPHELFYPAGLWTSSNQAQLTAIEHALTMATDKPEQKKIRIITDSRSAVLRLESLIHNNKPDTRTENNIQGLLEKMSHNDQHLTMVWCPGYCNIDGNERTDNCAN